MAKSTVQYGSQGVDVRKLQQYLNNNGYSLDEDGIFGNKTKAAVLDYQGKNGLAIDGIVGNKTWASLTSSLAANTANTAKKAASSITDFDYDEYQESDTVKNAEAALNNHLSQKPGEYKSQWQTQLDDTINKILNREKFSYDLNGDALYQQYKDKYIQQGKMAMQDTMGQAAAMTGGYGNSYAQAVGNQAYQASLQNLNDIVPELYQLAYDKYNQEGQNLYNQASILGSQEDRDYSRHRDSVGDLQSDRSYYQGIYDSERDRDYGKYSDDKSYAYNEHRNSISDMQWQAEFDEAKRKFDEQMAFNEKKYEDSKVSGGNDTDETYKSDNNPVLDSPVVDNTPDETAADYEGWDAGDWNGYFARIRQSEGADAAVEELNRMNKEGLIPRNMVSYASLGARGKLGH